MSPKPRQTKKPLQNNPNKGQGAAPLAGPSSQIDSLAEQAFGIGPIANSTFDFVPANDEETNALARLKRKEDEITALNTRYHDLLVERDARIDQLEKAVNSIKTEQSNARKEKVDLARDVQGYKETTEAAVAAKKKAEDELKFQKGVAAIDRDDAAGVRRQLEARDKQITAQKVVAVKFQERISEQAASLSELHKKVDTIEKEKEELQLANANLALQAEGTTNDVTKATEEFENMFKDLGGDLDLNSYVGHVRDLLGSGQLKRRDSSLSLQRQLAPQKSNQDLPSTAGKSLLDQLNAVDDAGSERSVPVNGDEDDDPTLEALGLGRPWTEGTWIIQLQDQEKKITELLRHNEELQAQVSSQTQQAGSISTQPTTQNLGFSTIQTLETAPIAGEPFKQTDTSTQTISPEDLGLSTIQMLETIPIAGEPSISTGRATSLNGPVSADAETQTIDDGSTQLLETIPVIGEATKQTGLNKLFLFLMLAVNLFLLVSNGCERWVWMAANDVTREAVVRAGDGGLAGLISPLLAAADRWAGVDSSMLG